ncbi:hypothetical protein KC357_g242 [Hortaea werneckii]|nr:hypothetical protein KC357_g242 [Hortaea werneckii]
MISPLSYVRSDTCCISISSPSCLRVSVSVCRAQKHQKVVRRGSAPEERFHSSPQTRKQVVCNARELNYLFKLPHEARRESDREKLHNLTVPVVALIAGLLVDTKPLLLRRLRLALEIHERPVVRGGHSFLHFCRYRTSICTLPSNLQIRHSRWIRCHELSGTRTAWRHRPSSPFSARPSRRSYRRHASRRPQPSGRRR